ncbi:MAG: tRNA guanosine(34) transglycosylase Tgt [Patescibacteria group bacterium]|nr:tRNA guanosine(34) transglycosylase Tgt [Patescibacteria group bacterium]
MLKIIKNSTTKKARLLEINLPSGKINAPFFMPDATRAVLKNIDVETLKKLNLSAQVVNTYHLLLQPGTAIIKKAGGVHKFMNWLGPLLSDSGGFQVFSLLHRNKSMGKIFDDRVEFKSPLDGSKQILTPEKSIQIQFDLGTDMMVCLDDCPPNDLSEQAMKASVDKTIAWARRCRAEFYRQIKKRKTDKDKRPLLFGVIQGGESKDERKRCAESLLEIGFDGLGYGARPIDKDGNFLEEILRYTASLIPDEYLRFGLGIGLPDDIVACVDMGWDMFDCVIPTREGRHGRLYEPIFNFQFSIFNEFKSSNDSIFKTYNIKNSKYKEDFSVINENSKLAVLREYSRAYLHHLFKIGEPLGQRLAALNNLEFYLELMGEIRANIK